MTWNLYSILLAITSLALTILWILSLQQCCITNLSDKARISNTISVVCFSTFAVIYSSLGYLSTMYPHFQLFYPINLTVLSHAFDAIMVIFGTHIFRAYQLAIIDRLYSLININPPKWIKIVLTLTEILLITICLISYCFAYTLSHIIAWMHIFYIILSVAILLQTIFMLFMLKKLLKILYNIQIIENINEMQIKSAKRAMKVAVSVAILLVLISIQFIAINIKRFNDNASIHDANSFIDNITHSIFMFLLTTALILGVYQKYECCAIYENSVCIGWCCGGFWSWLFEPFNCKDYHHYRYYTDSEYKKLNKKDKPAIVLHESTSKDDTLTKTASKGKPVIQSNL